MALAGVAELERGDEDSGWASLSEYVQLHSHAPLGQRACTAALNALQAAPVAASRKQSQVHAVLQHICFHLGQPGPLISPAAAAVAVLLRSGASLLAADVLMVLNTAAHLLQSPTKVLAAVNAKGVIRTAAIWVCICKRSDQLPVQLQSEVYATTSSSVASVLFQLARLTCNDAVLPGYAGAADAQSAASSSEANASVLAHLRESLFLNNHIEVADVEHLPASERCAAAAWLLRWFVSSYSYACEQFRQSSPSVPVWHQRAVSDTCAQMLCDCLSTVESARSSGFLQQLGSFIHETQYLSPGRLDTLVAEALAAMHPGRIWKTDLPDEMTNVAAATLGHNLAAVEQRLEKFLSVCCHARPDTMETFLVHLLHAYSETRRMPEAVLSLAQAVKTFASTWHPNEDAQGTIVDLFCDNSHMRQVFETACSSITPGQAPEMLEAVNKVIPQDASEDKLCDEVFESLCEIVCTVLNNLPVSEAQQQFVGDALHWVDESSVSHLIEDVTSNAFVALLRQTCALMLHQAMDNLAIAAAVARHRTFNIADLLQSASSQLNMDIGRRNQMRLIRAALWWVACNADELQIRELLNSSNPDVSRSSTHSIVDNVIAALQKDGHRSISGNASLLASVIDIWDLILTHEQLQVAFQACIYSISRQEDAPLRAICDADLLEKPRLALAFVNALAAEVHEHCDSLLDVKHENRVTAQLSNDTTLSREHMVSELHSLESSSHRCPGGKGQMLRLMQQVKHAPLKHVDTSAVAQLHRQVQAFDRAAVLHCLRHACAMTESLVSETRSALANCLEAVSGSACSSLFTWLIASADALHKRTTEFEISNAANISESTAFAASTMFLQPEMAQGGCVNSLIDELRKHLAALHSIQASLDHQGTSRHAVGMVPRKVWHNARQHSTTDGRHAQDTTHGRSMEAVLSQASLKACTLSRILLRNADNESLVQHVLETLHIIPNELAFVERKQQSSSERSNVNLLLQSLASLRKVLLSWRWRRTHSRRKRANLCAQAAHLTMWSSRLMLRNHIDLSELFADAAACFAENEQFAMSQHAPLSRVVHARIRAAFMQIMLDAVNAARMYEHFRRYIHNSTVEAANTSFNQMLTIACATRGDEHQETKSIYEQERCRVAFKLADTALRGHPAGRNRRFLAPMGERLIPALCDVCRYAGDRGAGSTQVIGQNHSNAKKSEIVNESLRILEGMVAKRVSYPLKLGMLSNVLASACAVLQQASCASEISGACMLIARAQRCRGEHMQRLHCLLMQGVRSALVALQSLESWQSEGATDVTEAAKSVSRMLEAASERTDRQRPWFCAHALALIAMAFVQPLEHQHPATDATLGKRKRQESIAYNAISRQLQNTLRLGVFALLDKCPERELSAVYKQLGTGDGSIRRWALSTLREEHMRTHKFSGKY